jgi:DNA gyrase subunit B
LEKKGKKFKKIHRSKGLGENTPDMLWDTTMNPATRRLVKLDIDINNEYVRAMSNMLFGNDTNNDRKDYIFDVLSNGLVDLEVEKSVIS